MSESKYLKCLCQNCNGPIEFPADGIGSSVHCPHCGQKTTLFATPAADGTTTPPVTPTSRLTPGMSAFDPSPAPLTSQLSDTPTAEAHYEHAKPKSRLVRLTLLPVVLAGTAGLLFVFRDNWPRPKTTTSADNASTKRAEPSAMANHTFRQTDVLAVAKASKSIDDLKVSAITLEKGKGSSLVYAVGKLKNNSDHQRFGVNVELEMVDGRGNRVGTAKDYRSVLEPRQEWHFRGLVLDPKAVSAKLANIREEE